MLERLPTQGAEIILAPEDSDASERLKEAFVRKIVANDTRAISAMDHHTFAILLVRVLDDLWDEKSARDTETALAFDESKLAEVQKENMRLAQDIGSDALVRSSNYQRHALDEVLSANGSVARAFKDVVTASYIYNTLISNDVFEEDAKEGLVEDAFEDLLQKIIVFMIKTNHITRSSEEEDVMAMLVGSFNIKDKQIKGRVKHTVNAVLREYGRAPLFIEE